MALAFCVIALTAAVVFGGFPASAQAPTSWDDKSAAVFVYQRIGDDAFPEASLDIEQFKEHVAELTDGGYTVIGLPDLAVALRAGNPLPPRTVAITFEGAHRSILAEAVPLLLEAGLPFTVFAAPDAVQATPLETLGWDELRKLAQRKGVTIGLQTLGYERLAGQSRENMLRRINAATAAYREALGKAPEFFAYPFGEYDRSYRDIIAQRNFLAAFGQQSGVAYPGADIYALPRFTMTGNYGDIDRFRMTARALPLPVSEIDPADSRAAENPPAIGFTVDPSLKSSLKSLSCFASDVGRPALQVIGESRIELRLPGPVEEERLRINCTMPGPGPEDPAEEDARWRWFGLLLSVPEKTAGQSLIIQARDEPR